MKRKRCVLVWRRFGDLLCDLGFGLRSRHGSEPLLSSSSRASANSEAPATVAETGPVNLVT